MKSNVYWLKDEKGVLKMALPREAVNLIILALDVEAQALAGGKPRFVVKGDFALIAEISGVEVKVYLWRGDYIVEEKS